MKDGESPEINRPATDVEKMTRSSQDDPLADELSEQMLIWGRLWFGNSKNDDLTQVHFRLRQRLLFWLKQCIGAEAHALVVSRTEDISLAESVPLLTAFLGRRATIEISRRVLSDPLEPPRERALRQ